MEEVLDLLRQNARLSVEDISAMTKKTMDEVKAIIKKLEDDGVILKYAAIVNPEKDKTAKDMVRAEIQIQVQPQREHGFDAIADRIYRFPQVKSLYLMSGGYDLKVIIEGDNLKEVALFVSEKLSTLEGVRSTKTTFVLKTYKENDIVYVAENIFRITVGIFHSYFYYVRVFYAFYINRFSIYLIFVGVNVLNKFDDTSLKVESFTPSIPFILQRNSNTFI